MKRLFNTLLSLALAGCAIDGTGSPPPSTDFAEQLAAQRQANQANFERLQAQQQLDRIQFQQQQNFQTEQRQRAFDRLNQGLPPTL